MVCPAEGLRLRGDVGMYLRFNPECWAFIPDAGQLTKQTTGWNRSFGDRPPNSDAVAPEFVRAPNSAPCLGPGSVFMYSTTDSLRQASAPHIPRLAYKEVRLELRVEQGLCHLPGMQHCGSTWVLSAPNLPTELCSHSWSHRFDRNLDTGGGKYCFSLWLHLDGHSY